jgi:pyruvate dehydrogenase E1 component
MTGSSEDGARSRLLADLERKVLWLSAWMVYQANSRHDDTGGIKVGGHQASCASLATIMTTLYFQVLRPQDRVAVKPHASPAFHAIQYLLGRQSLDNMINFRRFKGAQSYPSRTKDSGGVDFSTGSVGLGVGQTLFSALVQDYVAAKGWMDGRPQGRMIALVGDAELDEGNIYESLLEGWKHNLRNCWWIIDYNRQSLDAVVQDRLWERHEAVFRAFGWDVVVLKYGRLQEQAFAEPGGEALRQWIEHCPNPLYSALCFQGGAAWRQRLQEDLGDQGEVSALIGRRSDDDLALLMTNLGGHDPVKLAEAFAAAERHDRPTCFIAYTVKGFGLPLAGHKDNHAGQMNDQQMDTLRQAMAVRPGHEWDPFEGLATAPAELRRFLDAVPFQHRVAVSAPNVPVPDALPLPPVRSPLSTQMGFGQLLHEIAREDSALAARIVTTSPDVTASTNLGPWVNRRGLFDRQTKADTFRDERIPSAFTWEFSPKGQHIELGIAEMNFFLMLSALGLSHVINGERLLPIGTLYDPFIYRGADALNYACYQDARFLLVGTPSGITLSHEGGAHQSIGTPLFGIAQDRLAAFEPAFVDELAVIMRFAFDYMQRNGDGDPDPDERTWLRDETGGSVYLRLSTRPIEQPQRAMTADLARAIVDGAYWLRPPGPNADLVVAFTGAVAPEAIAAVGLLAEDRRDIGLLAITSADRLNAGWTSACRARERGLTDARSHIERLLEPLPATCALVTVLDGHPATLAWLGSVCGHRTRSLGVEHFGQTGTIDQLYRHYGIDSQEIIRAAAAVVAGRPVHHMRPVMRSYGN